MREKSILIIWFLLIYINAAVKTEEISISTLLRTNQYFLISQQDSFTSIETDVPSRRCPTFMAQVKSSSTHDFRYSGFHLVRDSLGRAPPMIIAIKDIDAFQVKGNSSANIYIATLNISKIVEEGARKHWSLADTTGFSKQLNGNTKFGIKRKIKTTLFDSASHMLYVDVSPPANFELMQFYVNGINTPHFEVTHIQTYFRSNPISRFEWQEDQYTGKFYYKERMDNEIALFEIPMAEFIPTIYEGQIGTRISTVTDKGTLMGVNGGVFYHVNKKINGSMTTLSTSLTLAPSMKGIGCRITVKTNDVPQMNKLIIIKNHDYCMLKEGPNYDKKKCDADQEEYMASKGEEPTDFVKWLLVAVIVLFMVIILLFVYIYWLRSTFVSDLDRTHPNEYETEASLFVAKQRSFPSVYQDPALLDVSVDKWN